MRNVIGNKSLENREQTLKIRRNTGKKKSTESIEETTHCISKSSVNDSVSEVNFNDSINNLKFSMLDWNVDLQQTRSTKFDIDLETKIVC